MKAAPLLSIPLLLASCESLPQEKIPIPQCESSSLSIGEDVVYQCLNVSDRIGSMIEARLSFPLYVYVPGCGTCDLSSLAMDFYLQQTKAMFPYCTSGALNDAISRRIEETSILIFHNGKEIASYSFDEGTDLESFLDDYVIVQELTVLNPSFSSTGPTYFYPTYSFDEPTSTVREPLPEFLADSQNRFLLLVRSIETCFRPEWYEATTNWNLDGLLAVGDAERDLYSNLYGWDLTGWTEDGFVYDLVTGKGANITLGETSESVDRLQQAGQILQG